jgi:hypothetical protein
LRQEGAKLLLRQSKLDAEKQKKADRWLPPQAVDEIRAAATNLFKPTACFTINLMVEKYRTCFKAEAGP